MLRSDVELRHASYEHLFSNVIMPRVRYVGSGVDAYWSTCVRNFLIDRERHEKYTTPISQERAEDESVGSVDALEDVASLEEYHYKDDILHAKQGWSMLSRNLTDKQKRILEAKFPPDQETMQTDKQVPEILKIPIRTIEHERRKIREKANKLGIKGP